MSLFPAFLGNGVDLNDPCLLTREDLVGKIANSVHSSYSTLLRSPPASGKTSLLQLLQQALSRAGRRVLYLSCARAGDKRDAKKFLTAIASKDTFEDVLRACDVRNCVLRNCVFPAMFLFSDCPLLTGVDHRRRAKDL